MVEPPVLLPHVEKMDDSGKADQTTQLEPVTGGTKDLGSLSELLTGEGNSASQRPADVGREGEMEAAGLQFYHMDLYEPREWLKIFTDKPAESKLDLARVSQYPGAQGTGLEQNPIQDPKHISARDHNYLGFPEEEFATGGNLMDFSSILPVGNQFDPFQQIVDYSESASHCSDRLFSPVSDRSGLEESEAALSGVNVSEAHSDLGALRKDTSRETEYEMGSQEISEDTIPDVYCQSCNIPIPAFQKLFGSHKHHPVTPLTLAAEAAKLECQNNVKKLEQQLIQMETFVNHMEEIFVTVEENIGKQEHYLELQYDDLMQFLVQRYEDRSQELEAEKKLKLEKLYKELVSCGQSIDLYKELIEATDELFKTEDKQTFLKNGQTMLARLEEFLEGNFNLELPTTTEFEKFPTDMPEVQRLIDSMSSIPVPSAPVMCPQAPGTATSNSVRVRWSLSADDTVEHYQLYYRHLPRESTQQDEQPAVPLAPTITRTAVASCQDAALIEWESGSRNPGHSYTVEFCQVCSGCDWTESLTESLTGITSCKTLVELEPNENYLFYIRELNEGGCSERSSPIGIRTTGTQLYLNEQTAHLSLSILEDGLTIVYNEEGVLTDPLTYDDRFTSCAAVMGQLVPVRGKHYWEVEVTEYTEYRIGVASTNTPRDSYLGSNITSWCMRHTLTPCRSKFEFLHNGISPDLRITIAPKRIGILLDYDMGKLSFFNADNTQLLFTFSQQFHNLVNPCFALERSGILKICHAIPIPEFTKLP
ncbi:fibronectin type III and SPRY domain-containing protein 2 isoform X2 [Heterodontus francisci]|uniref:fibronectin type III and SPRY domain-containing protein 2 isoform X2 n=1 Tax=Heterodontus francisci TaxID=7792 RepID=UPI00355B7621